MTKKFETIEAELAWLLEQHEEDSFTGDYDQPEGYKLVGEEEDTSPRWFVDSTIVFKNESTDQHFGLTNCIGATEMQDNEWAEEIYAHIVTESQVTMQDFADDKGGHFMSVAKKTEVK